MKLVTIFFISTLGAQYNGRIDTVRDYIKLCAMLAVPFLAVVVQGDLGSGLVVFFSGAVIIMMSGARKEWVLSTIAIIIGLVSLILATDSLIDSVLGDGASIIKSYQMNRPACIHRSHIGYVGDGLPASAIAHCSGLGAASLARASVTLRSQPRAFYPRRIPTLCLPSCPRPLALLELSCFWCFLCCS